MDLFLYRVAADVAETPLEMKTEMNSTAAQHAVFNTVFNNFAPTTARNPAIKDNSFKAVRLQL